MTISFVNDSATIGTTEYSLPADTTTGVPTSQTDDCILQALIDFGAMTVTEQYRIKLYEKTAGAATQRLVEEWILTGAQSKPMFIIPSIILGEGWDITVTKLAGTDRAIGWSLRKVT